MISDAIMKLAGYKYYMAKKVESENVKIVDESEEQHVSLVKSRRGKGFMYYDTNSDAIIYSLSSNKTKENANETNDADESDIDISDDNLDEDDDVAGYEVVMHTKSTTTPNSTYLSLTVISSSLDFIQTLLDETPSNELTDFISHPMYNDAQTTSVEDSKINFFKEKISTRIEGNVYSDLRIKSVVRIVVKKKWGYGFLSSIVVRRSDDKEYESSYTDLPRPSLNDVKELYFLQVQDKLHHLPLEFVKDFNNALILFIKRVVIQNMVEDIRLGVESYQQTLNLTKPMMFFKEIDQKIPFTMTTMHKGVVYLNKYNIKSLMKLSEVKKFYDGTLENIQENLIELIKRNKLGTGNKRLKLRDWTNIDVEKSHEMVDKIDKILKHREQLRRLEGYVGGRPKIVNPRTFVRPM
uniref:Uncharacterized protein n=1 Tax=Tanacetum cinerariifolium TaxID=118510 RepID=A0A6L2N8W6_TANCI|nr:hypothetical protein [Tanacetum cinerariifolium]